MSSIINKIKDAVHSDHHDKAEGATGPHSSRAANAADPRVDSDRDGSHTVGGNTGGIGGTTGTHGTHGGLTGGSHNTTAGPHSSNIANKVDPRVDSDRDGSSRIGGTTGGIGGTTSGLTGSHGTHGSGLTGSHNTTSGPHSSNVLNQVDPRVDSDRDGSRTVGGNTGGFGGTTGGLGGSHGTAGGLTGSHGTHGSGLTGSHNTTSGPHSSNVLNQVDPRVDSDRDGSRTVGGNTGGFGGTTGGLGGSHGTAGGLTGSHGTHGSGLTGSHNTTSGPHSSNIANKVDPRVDSDRDGSHALGGNTGGFGGVTGATGTHGTHGGLSGNTFGSGPAPNTAGPHKSDMLNKVDPRVDSDRDGSSTMGGNNQTYRSTGVDPTDAAQVPPSVLRKHIGEPSIDHTDHGHHRERRNSTATHQETFRGI